ncbi:MAG TPA: hypothetical protein VJB70_04205 [Candidatus Paceibacterota bacterium]
MPLGTVWRDPKLVTDKKALVIRDHLHRAMVTVLKVEPKKVELRVRDIGPLDKNYMPIGIEIDTGTGKERQRLNSRVDIAIRIAALLAGSRAIPKEWLGPEGSYVWLRICESVFVPIGHPENTR